MLVLILIDQFNQKMGNVLCVTGKKKVNITVNYATSLKNLKDFVINIIQNKDLEQVVNTHIDQGSLKMENVKVVIKKNLKKANAQNLRIDHISKVFVSSIMINKDLEQLVNILIVQINQ